MSRLFTWPVIVVSISVPHVWGQFGVVSQVLSRMGAGLGRRVVGVGRQELGVDVVGPLGEKGSPGSPAALCHYITNFNHNVPQKNINLRSKNDLHFNLPKN